MSYCRRRRPGKVMRLEFSSFVESDLDGIAAFIADDNPR
jgi:plasmid stabilization system protein ParE